MRARATSGVRPDAQKDVAGVLTFEGGSHRQNRERAVCSAGGFRSMEKE